MEDSGDTQHKAAGLRTLPSSVCIWPPDEPHKSTYKDAAALLNQMSMGSVRTSSTPYPVVLREMGDEDRTTVCFFGSLAAAAALAESMASPTSGTSTLPRGLGTGAWPKGPSLAAASAACSSSGSTLAHLRCMRDSTATTPIQADTDPPAGGLSMLCDYSQMAETGVQREPGFGTTSPCAAQRYSMGAM